MINKLTETQKDLVGALVGLARATEGNFDKLTEYTPQIMIKSLSALLENSTENVLMLTEKVKGEKYRIVPDCSTCQSPCGRTFDYDLSLLKNDDSAVVTFKDILLSLVTALGYFSNLADANRYTADEKGLYKYLFFIGLHDAEPDYYPSVIFECANEVSMAMAACFDMSQDNIYKAHNTDSYVSVSGELIKNNLNNYYGALALASQKGEMAKFNLSWNDPLQTALSFAIGEMALSCTVNLSHSRENNIDESVSQYLVDNYNIISD